MSNNLPDFIQDKNEVLYDIEVCDDDTNANILKKIKYRIGTVVILVNYLEREIDSLLNQLFCDDYEDPSFWILIKDLTLHKKIEYAENVLIERLKIFNKTKEIKFVKEIFKTINEVKNERNIYVHANWLNAYNKDYIEIKVQKIKNDIYRIRKKITFQDIDNTINKIEKALDDFNELFVIETI